MQIYRDAIPFRNDRINVEQSSPSTRKRNSPTMLLLFPKSYIHAYWQTAVGLAVLYLYPHLWPAWYSVLTLLAFIMLVGLVTPRPRPRRNRPQHNPPTPNPPQRNRPRHNLPRPNPPRQNEGSLPRKVPVYILAFFFAIFFVVYKLCTLIVLVPFFAVKLVLQKVFFFVSFPSGITSIRFHGSLDDTVFWTTKNLSRFAPLLIYLAVAATYPVVFVWHTYTNTARRLSWVAIFIVHFLLFTLALTIVYPFLGLWGMVVDFAHQVIFQNPGWEASAPKIVHIVI